MKQQINKSQFHNYYYNNTLKETKKTVRGQFTGIREHEKRRFLILSGSLVNVIGPGHLS